MKDTKQTKTVRAKAKRGSSENTSLGFEADEIVGASDLYNGELTFRIKVKDSNEFEYVSAKKANIAIPELVIQFYEQRLRFQPLFDSIWPYWIGNCTSFMCLVIHDVSSVNLIVCNNNFYISNM